MASESPANAKDRTYHNTSSPYLLPNDTTEQSRLDGQSAGIKALLGNRTSLAPLRTPPSKILDVGCGTGFATLDFARQYPAASVYGLDLSSPPEWTRARTPATVDFIQGNILDLSPAAAVKRDATDVSAAISAAEAAGADAHADGNLSSDPRLQPTSFDLFFGRALVFGIDDWPAYFLIAHRLLKPGGWVEHQDPNIWLYDGDDARADANTDDDDDVAWEWFRVVRDASAAKGLDLDAGSNAAAQMRDAGFVDVSTRVFWWPTVPDEKHPESVPLAQHTLRTMPQLFEKLYGDVLLARGFAQEKVEELKSNVRRTMCKEVGMHFRFYVTIGRKLGTAEAAA